MIGVVGLYVGSIHAEVKRRPLYVVERITGFEEQNPAVSGESRKVLSLSQERKLG
jgi:dolichol-phosphate mannosyltransferase